MLPLAPKPIKEKACHLSLQNPKHFLILKPTPFVFLVATSTVGTFSIEVSHLQFYFFEGLKFVAEMAITKGRLNKVLIFYYVTYKVNKS